MKLEIPFLGKTKERYLQEGIRDFQSRLSHYVRVEIKEIRIKKIKSSNKKHLLDSENQLIESQISAGAYRVVLDSRGQMLSSETLSNHLNVLENRGIKRAAFIIGGPLGLAEEQVEKADLILSLSKLTFPHDMVRLLLLEQLYRAYTIKAGEKYHK